MRIATSPFLLLALLAAALPAAGCRPLLEEVFRPPKVRVVDVALVSSPLADPDRPWSVTLTLEVHNPNPYSLRVAGVAYSAIIEDRTVADGERSDEVEIAPSAATIVRFPVAFRPEAAAAAARQILSRHPVRYELNGSVALVAPIAGIVHIPFSRTGTFDPAEILKRKGTGLN